MRVLLAGACLALVVALVPAGVLAAGHGALRAPSGLTVRPALMVPANSDEDGCWVWPLVYIDEDPETPGNPC